MENLAVHHLDTEHGEPKKVKTAKIAMTIGYCGINYRGFQYIDSNTPTIELALYEAIRKSGWTEIPPPEFSRASRTDKGVSAMLSVVSFMSKKFPMSRIEQLKNGIFVKAQQNMLLLDATETGCLSEDEDSKKMVDEINANLPLEIRCFNVYHMSNKFSARHHCSSRKYHYLIPMDFIVKRGLSLVDAVDKLRIAISMYMGTKAYHNFTKIPQLVYRYMTDCTAESISIQEHDYVMISFTGDSFVQHQIRKMVFLAIAEALGYAPAGTIQAAMDIKKRMTVYLAPATSLYLYKPDYSARNRISDDWALPMVDQQDDRAEDFLKAVLFPRLVEAIKVCPRWAALDDLLMRATYRTVDAGRWKVISKRKEGKEHYKKLAALGLLREKRAA